MEEAIRKLEKMIENPSRADKIVYTRGDIEDAIEGINRLKDKIKKLEQENKNLKLILEQMENTCKDYLNDRDTLREDNRKLKENGLLGQATMEEAYNRIEELEERIRFLEQCLDNKEKVNKSLREENKKLKDKLESLEK